MIRASILVLLVMTASAWAAGSPTVWEKGGSVCVPKYDESTAYVGYTCHVVGPAYKKMGLAQDEIITAINGRQLTSLEKEDAAIAEWKAFDADPRGVLEVQRKGKPVQLRKQ